jgi:aerobic-type carbon monoxide dehydrogenase small subunit (CoxS/CutS family)
MSSRVDVSLTVNGQTRRSTVDADQRLLAYVRENLGLTGSKAACELGVCGACTVLVDGRPTSSCSMLTAQANGREVLTVEGLESHPELRVLQEAFITEGGFQCGYCTGGQLVAAAVLVLEQRGSGLPLSAVQEHMLGNLCRCTGYYGILRAVEVAIR